MQPPPSTAPATTTLYNNQQEKLLMHCPKLLSTAYWYVSSFWLVKKLLAARAGTPIELDNLLVKEAQKHLKRSKPKRSKNFNITIIASTEQRKYRNSKNIIMNTNQHKKEKSWMPQRKMKEPNLLGLYELTNLFGSFKSLKFLGQIGSFGDNAKY